MEKAIKEVERMLNQFVMDSMAANHPRHGRDILRVFTRGFARSFLLAVFCAAESNEHKETLDLAQTILEEEAKNAIPSQEEFEAASMLAEAIRKLRK